MARRRILGLILSVQCAMTCPFPALAETANAAATNGQTNLNLSSTQPSMPAPNPGLGEGLIINVGGRPMHVTATSVLTPAQYVAATQVLANGSQQLQIGPNGNATGGSFAMTPSLNQALSNLMVPQGVKMFDNFGANSALGVSGTLTNAGSIFAYSTSSHVDTANIAAHSVNNLAGGLLTTVAQSIVPGAISKLNLSITTVGDFINSGTVSSSGNITLQAGGAVINALSPASTNLPAPVMQAASDVSLTSGNGSLVNAGLVSSTNGSINIATASPATNLQTTAYGGTFAAPLGDINFRDSSYTGSGNVSINGGDFQSQNLNLFSGSGQIDASLDTVSGQLNSAANVAHIAVDHGTLNLGEQCITGDPTFINANGGIIINGLVTAGESLAILADGDITVSGNGQIRLNSFTSTPFNLTMVAGAKITANGNADSTTLPGGTPTAVNVTVDFSQGNGGDINLTGSSAPGPVIDTSGVAITNGAGGSVVLAARHNAGTGGRVILPSNAINASGDGTGANGGVTIIAGAPNGVSISSGAIATNRGTGTAGNITMVTAQPTGTGGPTVDFDPQGTAVSGGPIVPSATIENADIALTSDATSGLGVVSITSRANAGNITLQAGGDITTSTILGGANVTMTSGGANGIRLQGYGILAPASTVTLTTTGTGDIRGATRLITQIPLNNPGSLSVLLPNGQFVYASDGNSIDVISTATYSQFGAPIAVGTNPYSAVFSSNSNGLYVTNSGSGNVSVIDTGSNTVVSTIAVGTNPQGIAVTPNGQFVYVANNGSGTVSVIDTSTDTVVATVSLAGSGVTNPTGIAINTSQNLVYVSDSASSNIAVINSQTNTLTGTTITALPLGANNASLTFMQAGNLLYAAVASGPGAGTYAINTTVNQLTGSPLPAGQTVNFYPQGTVGLITAGANGTFRFDTSLGTGVTFGVPTTGGFGSPVGTVPNSFVSGQFQGVNYQAFLPSANSNAINAFQTASVVANNVVLASKSGNVFINTLTNKLTAYSGGDSTKNVFISQIGDVTLQPATVDVGTGPMTVNSGVGGIFQLGSSQYNGLPASMNVSVANPNPAVTASTVYLFTPTGNIGTPANPFTLGTLPGQQLHFLVTAEANVSGLGNAYITVKGNDLSPTQPAVILDEVSVGGESPVDNTTGNFSLTATQGGINSLAVVSATTSLSLIAATNILQQATGGIAGNSINLLALAGNIQLNGPVIGSGNATILADGDITIAGNGHIQLSSSTSTPANLTMVAGAQITPGVGTTTIDFSLGNGGDIDLSGSTFSGTVISTAGVTGSGGAGGDVVLAARSVANVAGNVYLPSRAIDASGDDLAANGNISIFAGATSGDSISSGAIITNQAVGTAGDITMVTAQPTASVGTTVTFDTSGAVTAGGPISPSGTLENANIVLTSDASSGLGVVSITSGANAGDITLTAGGDISTFTILGGANVTMTSGGANGIRLQGYGILAPSSTITLTTTGTGDLRGATRLVTTLPLSTASTSMSVLLPSGRFVYASDANSVRVFSTSTYSQVGAAIPVGTNPFMGVYSSNSNGLYVTNSGSNNVSVIDTGSNTVIATIPVGSSPRGVAVTPNGQFVYVANNGSNTVSVIDTSTNQVVATISLAGSGITNPTGIAINTSQNLAYVSDSASNTIALIDTQTNALTGSTISLPAGANNASLTFMPAGNLLYAAVASGGSAGTYAIDTTTNQPYLSVLPAGDTVNFYPQGTVGLITAGAGGTFRFDTTLGTGVTFGVNTSGGFGSPVGAVPNSFNNGEFQGVNYQAFLPSFGTNAINAFQTASVVGSTVVLASNSGNIFINTLTNNLTAYSGGDSTKVVFISQIGSVTLTPALVDVGTGPMTVNSGVGGTFQLGSSPYNGNPANINVAANNPSPAVTAATAYFFTPTGNIGTPANPVTISTISGQQLYVLVTAEANVSGRGNIYLNISGNDVGALPAIELAEVTAGGQSPVDSTTGNFSLIATQGGIGLNAVVSAMSSANLAAMTNIVQQIGSGIFSESINLSALTGNVGTSGVGNAIATSSSGSMTVNAGGSAFINQTGAFTLNTSQAGSAFQLNSTGSTTLHSIASLAGPVSVILGSSATTLNVAANSGISAANGTVLLENDNTTTGTITIGANSNITAGSATSGSGQVDIVIGPVPTTPVTGKKPANLTVAQSSGAKVFFGTNGITALAPTNSINASGRNVIFSTGTLAPSGITLGGGVSINARSAALLTNLDLTDPATTAQILAQQTSGAIGGNLIVAGGGVATGGTIILVPGNLSTILSGKNIPSGVTVTLNNFTTATPININLTAGQVVINGTEKFSGSAAVTNVNTTLGGTVFNQGPTGSISATNALQFNVGGNATYNGKLSAKTITLDAIAGSGGSISLGGSIGSASSPSITLRADGAGLITQTGGTISGKQIAASTGTGNILLPGIGTGSPIVSVNTGGNASVGSLGTLSMQNSSVGGALTVSSTTSLSILGVITAPTITLLPGTVLSLSGTVGNGTGTVDITLNAGSGMTRKVSSANILADSVTITTGKGALGTAAAPIQLTANTLTINSAKGSNAFINNTGVLTIDGTSVGGSLRLLSSAGLTVGNVNSIAGALLLTSATGVLQVMPGVSVTANGGNLLLQNLDTTSGTIQIGTGATVKASTGGGGNVTVFVGTGTAPRTNTTAPANVTPNISGTGRIFYGAASIVANPPTNTINAVNRMVIFSAPAGAITIDGGVTITCDPVGFTQRTAAGDEFVVDTDEDQDELQSYAYDAALR